MESIGERAILFYLPFTEVALPLGGLNYITIFNTLLVMALIFGVCLLGVRRLTLVPGRGQYLLELFAGGFDSLVSSSLEYPEQRRNRSYFPLISALFLFLLIANFMGFLPGPIFQEPTGDINTTLGLGILGVFVATYSGIRDKGLLTYCADMCGPLFLEPGIAGKLSALFFLPLNIIGELAKVVSISFRLFGNILGGSIIIVVVTHLTFNFVPLAIGLDGFFIFFVGAVQAFVFTMLTLTYIAVAIK
jgi:F-type H+-transporting ATPase subunit a